MALFLLSLNPGWIQGQVNFYRTFVTLPVCLKGETIFSLLERYIDELIFLIFFTLSGMFLDYSVLTATISLVAVYIPLRFLGKYAGTRVGATLAHAPDEVRHFTAFGLIPQGGIVVGLALLVTHRPAFGGIAQIILATIMGAVIIHELIGPECSKIALMKAGEISDGQGQPSSADDGESWWTERRRGSIPALSPGGAA